MIRSRIFSLLLVLGLSGLSSCQVYHNMVAHYNAHFLASDRMAYLEDSLYAAQKDDYNDVLRVLPPLDSTYSQPFKTGLEYVLSKASLPIKFHEDSKWVDDCYELVGKVRMYRGDDANAQSTFKYLYANAKKPEGRQRALIYLMYLFADRGERANFHAVKEYFTKEPGPISPDNLVRYYECMAHFYRQEQNYAKAAHFYALAMPQLPKKRQGRGYFVLGQLYEQSGQPEKAYEAYVQAQQRTQGYDLRFFAGLGLEKTRPLAEEDQKGRERQWQLYARLLKDGNNWDYRDKIYYDMAELALRDADRSKAFYYLNESVQLSTRNKVQKGYSYLRTGRLHEEQGDYAPAAAYYDSALQLLPKTMPTYAQVSVRAQDLGELAKLTEQLHAAERKIRLANLSEQEQAVAFEQEIAAEKESIIRKREQERLGEQRRKKIDNSRPLPKLDGGKAVWYFYNPEAILAGQTAFLRKWGGRKLEDDWRRGAKPLSIAQSMQDTPEKEQSSQQEDNAFASVKTVEARAAELPRTSQQWDQVRASHEEALFGLGKLYVFRLKDWKAAATQADLLLQHYPQGRFSAEYLYVLIDFCKQAASADCQPYARRLLADYPDSEYAKMLANPHYVRDQNQVVKQVHTLYAQAFDAYKQGQYPQARTLLDQLQQAYPTHELQEKADYLYLLVEIAINPYAKTLLRPRVQRFLQQYPDSPWAPVVKQWLGGM